MKDLLSQDFNFINIKVLKNSLENFEDYIVKPSFALIACKWLEANPDIEEDSEYELNNKYEKEILQFYVKQKHFPVDRILLEAREPDMETWISTYVDELFNFGIGVIRKTDLFNTILFVSLKDFNFDESHWLKFYESRISPSEKGGIG